MYIAQTFGRREGEGERERETFGRREGEREREREAKKFYGSSR